MKKVKNTKKDNIERDVKRGHLLLRELDNISVSLPLAATPAVD